VRSLKIEVQSYKEDNERLMKEQNQINAQVMQSLNQLHRQAKKGSSSRHEEGGNNMKEEITTEELVIQEVLVELIGNTHLLTQQGNFMHLKTP
jgi:hypothetical protein